MLCLELNLLRNISTLADRRNLMLFMKDCTLTFNSKIYIMDTSNIKINKSKHHFPIVAIGTVASEFNLLQKIISDLPEDSGMAFIIIENLAVQQSGHLAEKLTKYTNIPVTEIVNKIDFHPNHIYIIPENNFLVLENEILNLKPKTRLTKTGSCFDTFFEVIAETYQSYAIGLLISQIVPDGSAGLKRIKEFGGSVIAVVPPKGASKHKTAGEFIDYFITANDVAEKLAEIHQSYLITHAYPNEENPKESTPQENMLFKQIIDIIHQKSGTNFQHYKHQTLRRRIAKRMVVTRQDTIENYQTFLKNNAKEQEFLFDDMLIPVTYFFRDPDYFDSLSQAVFPALINNLKSKNLRIWSAGCSTGEEAYSLAICIDEYLRKANKTDIKVQIIASDLSEKCIAKARSGTYTTQDVKNISEERLANYFTKRDSRIHINKSIRDLCVFAVHDLTKDVPFSRIDFISCRNVFIYFDMHLQNQIFSSFHYALRDKGILFLGKSESANGVSHLFTVVERQEKVYMRKNIETLHPSEIFQSAYKSAIVTKHMKHQEIIETDYKKIASDILLEQYSPAAVIINENLEIVYFHGDTSPFLQPSPGKASFNILSMVRNEVGFDLRNNILKARNEKKNFQAESIVVKNQSFLTSFEIIFLPSHPELLLIIFCKQKILPLLTDHASNEKTLELEKELSQLRGDFKRVTEEQQIYFEELQTTNEELLSSTEELQIINKQLETSAEELQSNNEELSCINDELRDRREELASMRNFYESIVRTIREPLIIIDKDFIIKSANPAFYKYFKTTQEETEEYSIFEIGNSHWNIPEFKESVLKKIGQNNSVENFKIQFNFDTGGKKIMIINAAPIVNSIPEGMILLAIEDITDLEQSSEKLKVKNLELNGYSRQLETFTTSASHNLLEPVRKISMFGKKVLDSEKNISESGKHNLNRLISSAANMNQLIEDLIDYSKINFAQKVFKKTDLNLLIKKVLVHLKPVISSHKAIIKVEELPTISGITAQIRQLFIQLILNAIKYAKPETAPEVKINMELPSMEEITKLGGDSKTNYVKITVSDNGIGFDKNFETLVFDPFYKLHSNEKHYSSGLGLTKVQKIIANHNGFIEAESEHNKGTIIYLYLPL